MRSKKPALFFLQRQIAVEFFKQHFQVLQTKFCGAPLSGDGDNSQSNRYLNMVANLHNYSGVRGKMCSFQLGDFLNTKVTAIKPSEPNSCWTEDRLEE